MELYSRTFPHLHSGAGFPLSNFEFRVSLIVSGRRISNFQFAVSDFLYDRQCSVTGPSTGWTIGVPFLLDSSRFAFNPKYHFAGRSASSISINRGLCFSPSACWIMVSWS